MTDAIPHCDFAQPCPGFGRLMEENTRLRVALRGLIERLDYVHADPSYKSVWMINQAHVGPYTGPTYAVDLEKARHTLEGDYPEKAPGWGLPTALLALFFVWEFAVIDQSKSAIATSVLEAPSPFVLAAESVVKFDITIKPERNLSTLKIDSIADVERRIQQTVENCTSLTRFNDQFVGHLFADDVIRDVWKICRNNELIADFLQDRSRPPEVLKRVADAGSINVLIEHTGRVLPSSRFADDISNGLGVDLNEQVGALGAHESASIFTGSIGGFSGFFIGNAGLARLDCGDLSRCFDLPFSRTPEFVGRVPKRAGENCDGERSEGRPKFWRLFTQPFYARDYDAFASGAVIVVATFLLAVTAAAWATRREKK